MQDCLKHQKKLAIFTFSYLYQFFFIYVFLPSAHPKQRQLHLALLLGLGSQDDTQHLTLNRTLCGTFKLTKPGQAPATQSSGKHNYILIICKSLPPRGLEPRSQRWQRNVTTTRLCAHISLSGASQSLFKVKKEQKKFFSNCFADNFSKNHLKKN